MTSNVPEIRFDGYEGEWRSIKFEQMLDADDGVRRGPFGSALKKDCFTEDGEYVVYEQHNAIYDEYKTRYRISKEKYMELKKFDLQPNDFIMSGAGTIGRISRVPDGIEKGVFNQALIRLRINSKLTDHEYFLQFIRAEFMQKKLTGANPGSAINNLVPMSEVKKWAITTPSLREQQAIGSFFKELDDRIALQQTSLESLKETKQGFLQKMFPKKGETTPEIRFEGFEGEWEEVKVSDLFQVTRGQVLSVNNVSKDKTKENPYPVYSSQTKENGLMGYYNNFLFDKGITWTTDGANAGTVVFRDSKFYSTNVNGVLLSDDGYVNKAMAEIINLVAWKHVSRVGNPKLMNNVMENITVTVPNSKYELEVLSDFFKELDDLIALEERELELLKETKKAFLQKMFV